MANKTWMQALQDGMPDALGQSTMANSVPVAIANDQSAIGVTPAAGELHLGEVGGKMSQVSASFARPADNAAYTLLWANRTSRIGYIDFLSGNTEGSGSTAANSLNATVRLPFVCAAASRNVFGLLETLDAFTPASAQNFFIELYSELDNATTAEGLARINDVLTANGAPNLPVGITVRQALAAIAPGVDFDDFDLG